MYIHFCPYAHVFYWLAYMKHFLSSFVAALTNTSVSLFDRLMDSPIGNRTTYANGAQPIEVPLTTAGQTFLIAPISRG